MVTRARDKAAAGWRTTKGACRHGSGGGEKAGPVGRVDRSAESKPKRALPLLFTKRTAQCIPRRLSATKKPTHWLPVDAAKTRFGDVGA
ncbi:hypothetical protein L1887_48864 [Cichorium endivia]|nr:hypothetical protein L1887_48864 [Cichorium endivia]